MTLDRNRVTNPNTTTVISDHNGRSTSTSTDRAVMYSSCCSTALMRSSDTPVARCEVRSSDTAVASRERCSTDMAVASRDLQEDVFEGWLLDVDVDNPHATVADLENGLRHQVLLRGDHHHAIPQQ